APPVETPGAGRPDPSSLRPLEPPRVAGDHGGQVLSGARSPGDRGGAGISGPSLDGMGFVPPLSLDRARDAPLGRRLTPPLVPLPSPSLPHRAVRRERPAPLPPQEQEGKRRK